METLTKTTWTVDTMHSEVQFKAKHLVISTVTGTFNKFEGKLESENEDFDGANAEFSIDVKTIDTNVPDRDSHLKSADFFDADTYPHIFFKNGELKKNDDGTYKLSGDLTVKDVTRQITLDVEYGGTMIDGYGQTKAGFEIMGSINRKEFGLTWNQVTEAGGVVVGDTIRLILNIQLTKN